MNGVVMVHGERYLAAGAVAECFAVEVRWVRQAIDCGLADDVLRQAGDVFVAVRLLDRLARARALELHTGLELALVALLLASDPSAEAEPRALPGDA